MILTGAFLAILSDTQTPALAQNTNLNIPTPEAPRRPAPQDINPSEPSNDRLPGPTPILSPQFEQNESEGDSSEPTGEGFSDSESYAVTQFQFTNYYAEDVEEAGECDQETPLIFDRSELANEIVFPWLLSSEEARSEALSDETEDEELAEDSTQSLSIAAYNAQVTEGQIPEREFSLTQLLQLASEVSQFYAEQGYRTSGAIIFIPDETEMAREGDICIKVIEGELEDIDVIPRRVETEEDDVNSSTEDSESIEEPKEGAPDEDVSPATQSPGSDDEQTDAEDSEETANDISSSNEPTSSTDELVSDEESEDVQAGIPEEAENSSQERISEKPKPRLGNYVRARLGVEEGNPLNVDRLQEKLQLLQLDPLIESISATLSAGARPGISRLVVEIEEAPYFNGSIFLDNGRSPSVASFRRGIELSQANLLTAGDTLSLGYTNTDGSNSLNTSYLIPLSPQDLTLRLSFNLGSNGITEEPFDDIDGDGDGPDIESDSRSYEIALRQPVIRTIQENTFQELALGLAASLEDRESTLLDIPFPLSPGADDEGNTRVFALRFSQDWTLQNALQVIAVRSQFNLGLNAFGASNNDSAFTTEEIPDSSFLSWRGQAQWVRRFGNRLDTGTLLVIRTNMQLASDALLSSEQFGIGGFGSVRGYRQDTVLTDNGIFASAELRWPALRTNVFEDEGVIQLIPFVDFGTGWNSSSIADPDPNTLASVGLGLQWLQSDRFSARLDWGIPLISDSSSGETWQENGILFSIRYNPF